MSENIITAKNTPLKDTLNNFIISYSERSNEIDFSEWLNQKLQQEIPNLSQEAGKKLTSEIIQAVSDYENTLSDLNTAIDSGVSKEEWFAEKLEESYQDMPQDTAGEKLLQIEEAYAVSNMQLMENDCNIEIEGTTVGEEETIVWNKYSLKNKVYDIGKQVAMSGAAVAANALKVRLEDGEAPDISDTVKETLQDGLIKDSSEVKAVVAGAVKAAAEKGLEKALPSDTPTEYICDMAGAAVEGAEALFDAARGKITVTEALDKGGRAAVAAGCRIGRSALKGAVSKVPYVGPLLVDLLGGLFDHMESPEFFNNVYVVVHDAAKATWQGIKEKGKRIFGGLLRKKKALS